MVQKTKWRHRTTADTTIDSGADRFAGRDSWRSYWVLLPDWRCYWQPSALTVCVLSYMLTERRCEIGIRVALGAARSHVLTQIMKQGLQVTALGVTIGLAGALAINRADCVPAVWCAADRYRATPL